jgi:hypothetical protein
VLQSNPYSNQKFMGEEFYLNYQATLFGNELRVFTESSGRF